MPATYLSAGAVSAGGGGATTSNPPLGAGWAANDLAVLVVASAHEDDALPTVTPTGGPWTYAGSETMAGGGAFAEDAGPRRLTFYTRVLATGDGTPAVVLPASTWAAQTSQVLVYRKAVAEAWRVISPEFGEDTTSATTFSATLGSIPSQMSTDAQLLLAYAPVLSTASATAEAVSATGATVGTVTERGDASTANGANARLVTATATVTAGAATAAPVVSATLAFATIGLAGVLVIRAGVGSLTAQQAARGEPLRYNGFTNPGAEGGTTAGWTVQQSLGSTTIDVVDVEEEGLGAPPSGVGRNAFRITGAATNTTNLGMTQGLTTLLPAGTTVTVSVDVYLPAGSPVDELRFDFAPTATGTSFLSATATGLTAGWKRVYGTITVPAGSTLGGVKMITRDTAGARGSDIVYLDNLMFDVWPTLREYMDGNSTRAGYVYQWLGTPQFSETAEYLAVDPPRVGITLAAWAADTPTQVYRVHPDGSRHAVRGGLLTPSGGVAFVWDYEFPTNAEVYYVADDSGVERTTSLVDEVIVRRNGVRNPSLAVDATDWATSAASSGTATATRIADAADGPLVAGVRRDYFRMGWSAITTGAINGTGPTVGVTNVDAVDATPGPWTGSMYWRCNVPDRTVRLEVTFYNAAGNATGAINGASTAVGAAARWSRVSVSGTAPAATVWAVMRLMAQGGAVWTLTSTIDATAALAEDNVSTVGAYFDGDTPGVGYRWAGTPSLSFSEAYATDVPTPTLVADDRAFLRAPGLPGLDCAVRVQRVPEKSRPRPITYLAPIGRRTLVPLAGARQAPQFSLELVTLTDAEADALLAFMEGSAHALLLHPGTRHHATYVTLSDVAEKPNPRVGPQEVQWTAAATEVEAPAGGIAYDPSSSWAGILATSGTWQSVLNTYPAWVDVLRGPPAV